MKRPSNLIIAFVVAIASVFFAYALSRMFFRLFAPPEIEIEENLESQIYTPQAMTLPKSGLDSMESNCT